VHEYLRNKIHTLAKKPWSLYKQIKLIGSTGGTRKELQELIDISMCDRI
jgi:D-arabinose 1-dehydrogenase-like Zn-dependent alcohol dehydrogenase